MFWIKVAPRTLDLFFSILVFFQEHYRFTEQQWKGEAFSFTPHYHFELLHRHLNISRAITAGNDYCRELTFTHSSKTWTRNFWFPSTSHWLLNYVPLTFIVSVSEVVAQRCSEKKVFLEISQNSQKTPVPESLFQQSCKLKSAACILKHSVLRKVYLIDCFLNRHHPVTEIWLLRNHSRLPHGNQFFLTRSFYRIYYYECGVQTIFQNLLLPIKDC